MYLSVLPFLKVHILRIGYSIQDNMNLSLINWLWHSGSELTIVLFMFSPLTSWNVQAYTGLVENEYVWYMGKVF